MKFKFKFLGIFICFFMTMSFVLPTNVNANELNKSFDKEYVSKFMEIKDKNIVKVVELYSDTNFSVATYLEFSPTGYMIIDNVSELPIEFSEDKVTSFISTSVGKVYYGGPLEYYIKDSTGYTDEFGNKQDIQTFESRYETSYKEYFNDMSMDKSQSLNNTYSDFYAPGYSLIPNYSYNPDGICGSTAAAMLLMYHDKYTNNYYVPSSLESSNGISFIEHLVPYIDGAVPGSTISDAVNGLNSYLNDQGFVSTAYFRSSYSLNKGVAMLGLTGGSKYREHWGVAYGIREYYGINPSSASIMNSDTQLNETATYTTVIMVDGWGSKKVFIDMQYIDCALYLK